MKMLRILAVLALFATAFAACKKDDTAQPQPTKTEMLVGGQWKVTAMTASPAFIINGVPVTDVLTVYPTCLTDNFQIFEANGGYTFDEGASRCDPSHPQRLTGTWTFAANESQIILNTGTGNEVWELPALSATQATTRTQMVQGGVTYTTTATLTKAK